MKNSTDRGGCYPLRPSATVNNRHLDLQNSALFNNCKKTRPATRVTPRATSSAISVCKHENPTTYILLVAVETNQVLGNPGKSLDDVHLY